jgi:hypothetical protein
MVKPNALPTTVIAGMTIAQYQTSIVKYVARAAAVSVDISENKQFMRPSIYNWFVSSPTLRTTATVSTYGTSGEMWALSFDSGASWVTVDTFGKVLVLLLKHFAPYQD